MNIDKLKEMNWKEKVKLVEETTNLKLLVYLANDKSKNVKKAILRRTDVPLNAIKKIYNASSDSNFRIRVIEALKHIPPSEELKKLLLKMVLDPEKQISDFAIKFYRANFKPLNCPPNQSIHEVTDPNILEDWAIQYPGYSVEELWLADNPNMTGALAHKFVISLLACEKNPEYIQETLFKLFKHKGIYDKTIQYVLNQKFTRIDENGYYIAFHPTMAISAWKKASAEILDKLVEIQKEELSQRIEKNNEKDEKMVFSGLFTSHCAFIYSLLRHPKLSKTTFDKLFDVFVKAYPLGDPTILCVFSQNKHFRKNQHLL